MSSLLPHLVVDVLFDAWVARLDLEQAKLIVDFIESSHELVVENDVLSIDGLDPPPEDTDYAQGVPLKFAAAFAVFDDCFVLVLRRPRRAGLA